MSELATHFVQVQPGTSFWLDEHGRAALAKHGFTYEQTAPDQYVISGPAEPKKIRDALGELDFPAFIHLKAAFVKASDPLAKALSDVHELKRLEYRYKSSDPSFPFGSMSGLPFSHSFDARLHGRFQEILDLLDAQGFSIKLGAELEFVLSVDPLPGFEDPISRLAIELLDHEKDLALKDPKQAEGTHAVRFRAMLQFGLRDFLMMHLLERDPVTQPVFAHSFGLEQGGNGYYDNENVFEIRTNIIDGRQFFDAYTAAQRHVLESVLQYRFKMASSVSQQLSLSLWQGDRNVLLCKKPEDEAITERMAHALGYMFEKGCKLTFPLKSSSSTTELPVISSSRLALVRHAYGRFEIKGFSYEAQHLVIGAIMGAGAACAAIDPEAYGPWQDHAAQIKRVMVPGVSFPNNIFPWLRHAVTASHINSDGGLTPDASYIRMAATKILEQMDPTFKADKADIKEEKGLAVCPPEHCETVSELISAARVVNDGGQLRLQWPEESMFSVGHNTAVTGSNLNKFVTFLGMAPRFIYPISGRHAHPTQMNDNILLPTVFGAELFNDLASAYQREIATKNSKNSAMDFVRSVNTALNDGMQDSEQGFAILTVPIEQRAQTAAKEFLSETLKILRRSDTIYAEAFKAMQLVGLSGNTETDSITGCIFYIPNNAVKFVKEVIAKLVQKIDNGPLVDKPAP